MGHEVRNPGGLWFGRSKPEMLTFLEPFVAKLKELETGITINNRKFGTFVSKAVCFARNV